MKILNLDKENAKLQFSIDELLILKNSLLEVYEQFTINDFAALIQGISKEDAVEFANLIENVVNLSPKNNISLPSNNHILSIKSTTKSHTLQLAYKSLLGLRGVLNVLVNNVCVVDDFSLNIGFDRSQVSLLLDSIHFNVVEKMQEDRPEFIIYKKLMEIKKRINFERHNLKANSSKPRITQKCKLQVNDYLFCFLLVSLKDRREFSGIQTSVMKLSNESIIMESKPQSVRNFDLIRLISYLELFVESEIKDEYFSSYSLLASNSNKEPIFDIKVISRCIESSNNKELLNICVKFYNSNSNQYFEAEDNLYLAEINSFIQSIEVFLSKLAEYDG